MLYGQKSQVMKISKKQLLQEIPHSSRQAGFIRDDGGFLGRNGAVIDMISPQGTWKQLPDQYNY
jgi:hypothetical protein